MRTPNRFLTLLTAALCWSCQQAALQQAPAPGLTLSLDSGSMQTRAATDFETAINHFDYFFFSDPAGTAPIPGMHARVSGSSTVLDTRDGQPYAPLRYNTSYLYMVANFPGTSFDHSRDWTLDELLTLDVDAPLFTEQGVCSHLVMDSYDSEDGSYLVRLTPREVDESRSVTVSLSRLAAKLTVELHVEPTLAGTEPGEVWTPILGGLQAYYVNALNNGLTLAAAPVRRAGLEDETGYDYIAYPATYPLTAGGTDYVFTTDPAYTYPQTWASGDNGEPYFKIVLPWISNVRGSANFYYKLEILRPAGQTRTLNRNSWYKAVATLSVIDTAGDYIDIPADYSVEAWAEFGQSGSPDLTAARYFSVPVREYELFSDEELDIPFYSNSAVHAYLNEISYYHYGTTDRIQYVFRYTGEANTNVTLPTRDANNRTVPAAARETNRYQVSVDNTAASARFTHTLAKVYTERTIKLTLKNEDGRSEQVIIRQHPSIEVKTTSTNNVFVNGHFARATAGVHVNGEGNRLQGVEYTTKYSYDSGQKRYHSSNSAYTANNSRYWLSWNQRQNNTTNGGWAGAENGTPLVYDMFWTANAADFPYGTVAGDWGFGGTPYQTIVAVSAFNDETKTYSFRRNNTTETRTYHIGDPRVASTLFDGLRHYLYQSSNLRSPAATGPAVYKDWEQPDKILMTTKNADDGNLIAPRILVCSFYNSILTNTDRGRGVNAVTYDDACRRAATFQENGYPAGRWRLPTEAEIMFMVQRQLDEVIPYLWATGEYWCANGRVVSVNRDTGVATFKDNASNTSDSDGRQRAWARFVYDLWYWGDDPMPDAETYWPNMHEH